MVYPFVSDASVKSELKKKLNLKKKYIIKFISITSIYCLFVCCIPHQIISGDDVLDVNAAASSKSSSPLSSTFFSSKPKSCVKL